MDQLLMNAVALLTAEAFVMKRMDPREASAYQEHLARCHAC
jgi:hypothetical protein